MTELAGQALLFTAILGSVAWSEMRSRAAFLGLRGELAELKRSIAEVADRLSALERRKNGADALAPQNYASERMRT